MSLENRLYYNFYNFQGSTWAPTLIHKEIWNTVNGFSEEFFPGTGSDPDFNMKLWNNVIRIFKGLNDCKVYHFGSIVLTAAEVPIGIKTGDLKVLCSVVTCPYLAELLVSFANTENFI